MVHPWCNCSTIFLKLLYLINLTNATEFSVESFLETKESQDASLRKATLGEISRKMWRDLAKEEKAGRPYARISKVKKSFQRL